MLGSIIECIRVINKRLPLIWDPQLLGWMHGGYNGENKSGKYAGLWCKNFQILVSWPHAKDFRDIRG